MRNKQLYLILLLLIIIGFASFTRSFIKYDYYIRDLLQTRKAPLTDIVIIAIDDQSIQKLGQWPWSRSIHSQLIAKIAPGKPAVIGLDLIFSERASDPMEDEDLTTAIRQAGNVFLPVFGILGKKTDQKGAIIVQSLVTPFAELNQAAQTGHINLIPDQIDGYARTALLSFDYQGRKIPSFDWVIAQRYWKQHGVNFQPTSIPEDASWRFPIDFTGRPGDFEHLSFWRVLAGEITPDYFTGKIVLIGPYATGIETVSDYYYTPIAKEEPMYGVEFHANVLQNMLEGNFKRLVPDWVNLLILLGISIFGFFTYQGFGPVKSTIIYLVSGALYLVIYYVAYQKGYILQAIYPLVLLAAVYIVNLGYSYLREFWEHQRVTNLFGRFVAPQVVSEILKGDPENISLGGTRKEICVLFADIRGFTPLSEKTAPEEVVGILNEYLDLCTQAIFTCNGTIDKFIGDAVMAIFNAPLEVEDYVYQAVRAAWLIKEGAEGLRQKLLDKYGQSVQFGIGVNTGLAIVGNIGSRFRMDYTAIGDTVNTAARLEGKAAPGQILLSKATYEAFKERIRASYLGDIKVKGKEQELPVYQLEGMERHDEK